MKIRSLLFSSIALFISTTVIVALPFILGAQAVSQGTAASASAREDAYRANNLGVALLEQYKYKEAAENFRRALQIDPRLGIARLNLAIALYKLPDLEAALREAKAAAEQLPDAPQSHYVLGLIARAQNRAQDAAQFFQRVLEIDPRDVGANVNLGQLHMQQRKLVEAISVFRQAVAAEPYNVTATYNLAIALLRSNQREEGQRVMRQFQTLRESNYGTTISQNYLEEGRYGEAIASTGAEPELIDADTPPVTFTEAASLLTTAKPQAASQSSTTEASLIGRRIKAGDVNERALRDLAASLAGSIALFDYDGDGDLDLFELAPTASRLYRNDGGKLSDVTAQSGLESANSPAPPTAALAGDYDNDGKADLFVLRYGGCSLYHNEGNGKFSDVTASAGVPAYPYLSLAAAFVDVDHDGDLDIFIAGFADLTKPPGGDANKSLSFPDDFPAAPNVLLRNNGNGKFTDVTATAQLSINPGRAIAIAPTDYDNRRDVDLLLVNHGGPVSLFANLRDGTFRNVAADVGLSAKASFTCAAAGDINKDNYTDFFFGVEGGPGLFAVSDGKGRFTTTTAPAASASAGAAQFIDYDNDGLLDLVLYAGSSLRVLRNLGGKWVDVSDRAIAATLSADAQAQGAARRAMASGDLDHDGDTDLMLLSASGLKAIRNDGGNRNPSLRVQLTGKVSNRNGVGTKVDVRAGSLKQKLEAFATSPAIAPADIMFGLGKRKAPDALRLLWPSGNVQSEFEFARLATRPGGEGKTAQAVAVTEVDRKPSSCPYLYTWNGERFEFITDFMGGGEMGYWLAPGQRNHPDPDEYVRITEDRLKQRNGRYEIRVTNELEEALYVDRLQLIAIAHPIGTEVFPNEGLVDPPRPPFKLYVTRDARPPLRAFDHQGRDMLYQLTRLDRQYVDGFKLSPIRGYAEQHTLTLDLGNASSQRALLLLTGWTDYAFSSDNVAAHQAGLTLSPPALQVKDGDGRWKTVIADIGIPVGRPQTIAVDLTGKFLSASREVRIITNMRIYWDQILVDTSGGIFPTRTRRLDPLTAELRWRGFSAETSPDGREPFGYDYERVSTASPWKQMAGRYTREGDVRQLLRLTDDMFVISRPGDEIAVSFDANKLAPLPRGWKRTFLLYADGFSKEMDINSASPDQVAPLPFHRMTAYPYPDTESYPMTRAHRAYLQRYNTRVVRAFLPREVARPYALPHGGAAGRLK